jgi:hypothetical protein
MSVRPVAAIGDNWSAGVHPIDFDADYADSVDWYGVPEEFRHDILDCAHDAVLDGTDASDLRPFHASTTDLDRFKDWIGLPDSYIRSGKAIAQPCDRPLSYDRRFADPAAELSEDERLDVFLAAGCYLFGDSAAVAEYRRAIELRMAPFDIAIYAARRVILRPTGSLTVSGPPAVVIAQRLEIHPGATIRSQTVSRFLSDHLVKIGEPSPPTPEEE